MGMTLGQIADMSLQLINQYSVAGTKVAASYNNQQDYINRINYLVNDAQNIIATTTKRIFARMNIVQNPVENAIKDTDIYGVKQVAGEELIFKAPKAKAYYFETYGEGKAEVWLNGVKVETVNFTGAEGFTPHKNVLIRSGEVELKFLPGYVYSIRNVALYDAEFKDASAIPACSLYNSYEMPDDFFQLVGRGIPYTNSDEFCMSHNYKWIGKKTLLLKSDLVGEWKLDYFRYPKQITQETASNFELENELEAQLAIPYYVAAHLIMYDDAGAYQVLMNEWELKLSRLGEGVHTTTEDLDDVYFQHLNRYWG